MTMGDMSLKVVKKSGRVVIFGLVDHERATEPVADG